MLVSEDLYDPAFPETGTMRATLERFSTLSRELLGESTNDVEAVMKWLRHVLHIQF